MGERVVRFSSDIGDFMSVIYFSFKKGSKWNKDLRGKKMEKLNY